jgi:hypothetical protein
VNRQARHGKLTKIDDEPMFTTARCGACGEELGAVSVPRAGEQGFMALPKWRKGPDGVWRLPHHARKFREHGNELHLQPLQLHRDREGWVKKRPAPPRTERIPPMPRVACEQCGEVNVIDPRKWDWAEMATGQSISTKRS